MSSSRFWMMLSRAAISHKDVLVTKMASNTFSPECYKLLKRYAYRYELLERWVPFGPKGGYRKDFLGFGDIIALRPTRITDGPEVICQTEFPLGGSLVIQACGEGDIQAHLRKATEGEPREALKDWLLCGNRFELWGFPSRKRKSRKRIVNNKSVLNVRFIRVTYENVGQGFMFYTDETTELTVFGYTTRAVS